MNNSLEFGNLDFLVNKTVTIYLAATPTVSHRYTLLSVIEDVGIVAKAQDNTVGAILPFASLSKIEWEWQAAQTRAAS